MSTNYDAIVSNFETCLAKNKKFANKIAANDA
mgnify:CR=1 FL=1